MANTKKVKFSRKRWGSLSSSTRAYGLMIYFRWGRFGRPCFQSQANLAELIGVDLRSIRRMEARLEGAGVISRSHSTDGRSLVFSRPFSTWIDAFGGEDPSVRGGPVGPVKGEDRAVRGGGPVGPGGRTERSGGEDPSVRGGGPSGPGGRTRRSGGADPSVLQEREEREKKREKKTPPNPPKGGRGSRKPATGDHAELVRFWESEWTRTRLGLEWSWQPKDFAAFSRVLKLGSLDEARRRATALLESQDRWMAENASPSLLLSRWNQLGVSVRPSGGKARSRAQEKIAREVLEDIERLGL